MLADCSQASPRGASGAKNKLSKTSAVGSVDDMMITEKQQQQQQQHRDAIDKRERTKSVALLGVGFDGPTTSEHCCFCILDIGGGIGISCCGILEIASKETTKLDEVQTGGLGSYLVLIIRPVEKSITVLVFIVPVRKIEKYKTFTVRASLARGRIRKSYTLHLYLPGTHSCFPRLKRQYR
jgi:hypothetical protein